MPHPRRVLMGPGPSNPYPEAVDALATPMLGHLDPVFLELLDETCARLRIFWGTTNALTLPLSGTGSAGMEAAMVNTISPGDTVVVAVNGLFGERMCDVAGRCGGSVVRVDTPWGQPVDAEQVLAAHPRPDLVAVVHAETSTGVCNDVSALAAGVAELSDTLLLADCVTSLGGIPVEIDRWGVDVAYSATQKCLGVAPGLSPFTMSDRVRDRVSSPRSWYFDLGMIADYAMPSGTRRYHHTAPVGMIMSLHAGLGAVLNEGLEHALRRHNECGQLLQDGLEEMGLELFAAEGHRLTYLTTVLVPKGVEDRMVRQQLLERYDIEIGGGVGAFAGKLWRIGCMGHTARVENVTLLLAALSEILSR